MFTVNAKPFISFKKWSFFFTKERNIHLQIRNTHSVRKQARTPFATRRSSCLHFMCIRSPSFFIIRFYRLPFMYTHLHTKHVRMLALYVCICACVCARYPLDRFIRSSFLSAIIVSILVTVFFPLALLFSRSLFMRVNLVVGIRWYSLAIRMR